MAEFAIRIEQNLVKYGCKKEWICVFAGKFVILWSEKWLKKRFGLQGFQH